MKEKRATVERIREFNRFYTVRIGTLNQKFLDSDYSVTETRILFELITRGVCSASELVEELHVDKGYLSRILKNFLEKGLIQKSVSDRDRRAHLIRLTELGQETTRDLIGRTDRQIGELVSELNEAQCREICMAMDVITQYLSPKGGK